MVRSGVVFFKVDAATVAVIEENRNGGLHGLGLWLATFFKKVKLAPFMEISPAAEEQIVCHEFGELVARFIRQYASGGFKLSHPSDTFLSRAEYTFFVSSSASGILTIQVRGCLDGYDTVEKISNQLTTKMSLDDFVEAFGSNDDDISSIVGEPPEDLHLEGSIIRWKTSSPSVKITARSGIGCLPIHHQDSSQYFDIDILKPKFDCQYNITISAVDDYGMEGPPSVAVKYSRGPVPDLAYKPTITGSRSLIVFKENSFGEDNVFAVVYQQWGGGLDGVGHTLATFLRNARISDVVTSAKGDKDNPIFCRTFGNLVAKFIHKIREDKGGHPFYLRPLNTSHTEENNYCVRFFRRDYSIQMAYNSQEFMSVDKFVEICEAKRSSVVSLRTMSTSVIMSVVLEQKALKAQDLFTKLPHYVPTTVKKGIVEAVFGVWLSPASLPSTSAAPSTSDAGPSTSNGCPPPAKRMALNPTT